MLPMIRQFHGLPYKQSHGLFMMLDFIELCLLEDLLQLGSIVFPWAEQ